jgi:nucleoside-diphosphate-sugar epimerase
LIGRNVTTGARVGGIVPGSCGSDLHSRIRRHAVASGKKNEVGLLISDSSKAKELLGWAPEVALADGLRATAEYVRAHLNHYDAGGYVI